ncbi:MAG: WG repeat-containing protein [Bacteroidota bacterium]
MKSNVFFTVLLNIYCISFIGQIKSQVPIPYYSKSGSWGYKNQTNHDVIKSQFEEAWPFFKTGLAVVKKEGKYGVINTKGEIIMPFIYEKIEPTAYYNKLYYAEKSELKESGFINEYGKEVVPCIYNGFITIGGCDNRYFCDGYALANNESILVDTAGIEFNAKGYVIGHLENGFVPIFKNGKVGVMNLKGDVLISPEKYEGDMWTCFSEGLAALIDPKTRKFGYINLKGELVANYKYDWASKIKDNVASVKLNDKWGYVDVSGKEIIPPQFSLATDFNNKVAFVEINDKKMLIDKTGSIVLDLSNYLQVVAQIDFGILNVQTKEGWGFVNVLGKQLTPFIYSDASKNMYTLQYNYIDVIVDGKIGCIDSQGKQIIPCQYSTIDYQPENKIFFVRNDLGWGVLDQFGKILIPCKYNQIQYVINGFAYVELINNEKKGELIRQIIESEGINNEYYLQKGFVDLKGKEYFEE